MILALEMMAERINRESKSRSFGVRGFIELMYNYQSELNLI